MLLPQVNSFPSLPCVVIAAHSNSRTVHVSLSTVSNIVDSLLTGTQWQLLESLLKESPWHKSLVLCFLYYSLKAEELTVQNFTKVKLTSGGSSTKDKGLERDLKSINKSSESFYFTLDLFSIKNTYFSLLEIPTLAIHYMRSIHGSHTP